MSGDSWSRSFQVPFLLELVLCDARLLFRMYFPLAEDRYLMDEATAFLKAGFLAVKRINI